jgi:hypothetical protein
MEYRHPEFFFVEGGFCIAREEREEEEEDVFVGDVFWP